jgi:hypothetical protein
LIALSLGLSLLVLTANAVKGQTIAHVRDSVYPGARVKALFERGRSVSRLRHVGTQWVVVMPEISGSLVSDTLFPHDAIQERWKQFAITDVTYAQPWWVAAMTRGTTLHEQRYVSADTFPKDFIERGWEERRHITSVAFGKGRYVVVMSKGTGYRTQRWVIRDSLPVSWIKDVWNEGYHVTGLTHVNGRWFVVASGEKFRPQQYAYAYRWPHHTVDSLVEVGYEVTDAAYGDSTYFVILTRYGDDRPMMSPRNNQPADNRSSEAPAGIEGSFLLHACLQPAIERCEVGHDGTVQYTTTTPTRLRLTIPDSSRRSSGRRNGSAER